MLNDSLQARIARNYADAMMGYSSAMTAAYGSAMAGMLELWTATLRAAAHTVDPPKSWYVPPADSSGPSVLAPLGVDAMTVAMNAWMRPYQQQTLPVAQSFNLFFPFAAFMPPMRSGSLPMLPAAWPMAFMMMAFGSPRDVAWPAAEANAAMLDTADALTQGMQNVFSSYRSDGGHAVARIVDFPRPDVLSAAMMVPLSGSLMAPWLDMMRALFRG